ncbi:gamma-glutamyltransferase 2. Threonine peptidase. MEROPS family T03 [Halovenus aranensis]|uniref:Gamma-glutamyltransferase 2. Threonine peptidase. MEROPS family T03 n=1 Tax=Halovenus aranensis TaxID=890420 RepID=A0A1G8XPM1_9EURY|nr:gamma-glutamyltransferase family protein [Halovenus aranensis]SDJ92531.1 gamma-glutamyltransferase 2. Threonine peptidase. MEROPS family T03 [Halovenus aranensis]
MDPDIDSFESRRSTVYAPNGVVATSQPLAAEAGVEILRTGGNAFDAAVATAAALNVVEPTSTGLGGDVFACYRTADGEVGAMRASGGAPQDATIEGVRERVADGDPEEASMPMHGPHTVTVPGTARGWEATVEELGRLSLADVLDPAIAYAIDGYPVTEVVSAQWQHAEGLFEDDHAREAYLFDGEAPDVGQTARLPRLGESMQQIAEEGADAVYEGAIGEAIVEEIQDKGGFMTTEDLADFEVEWPDPLSTTYNGRTIYELGPHNQGQLALEALNIAEEIGAGDHPYDSPDRVHDFSEAMKLAFHDGHYHVTDPAYEDVPPLHSKVYAQDRAKEIGDEPISDVDVGTPEATGEDADTVLLCVADDEGNVVSYINSRFAGFGSGLVAGETGIALQNRGASFSLDPEHPNRLDGGKRPFHTLVPGLAQLGEDDWLAFGVMGGYMQPQGHVQLISNLVDYEMPLQAALDAPRWRYREEGTLAVEEHMHEGVPTKLARRGHDVRVLYPGLFGGAQAVRNNDGTLSGATEPRKDGQVSGF